jgi:hypothetical protein
LLRGVRTTHKPLQVSKDQIDASCLRGYDEQQEEARKTSPPSPAPLLATRDTGVEGPATALTLGERVDPALPMFLGVSVGF